MITQQEPTDFVTIPKNKMPRPKASRHQRISYMNISLFDLFKIGIGPSSSHTVGPMRACHLFLQRLQAQALLMQTARVKVDLYGSLGATGRGHASDTACLLGLMGEQPETTDPSRSQLYVQQVYEQQRLALNKTHEIVFNPKTDLILHRDQSLPEHPNGMQISAYDRAGTEIQSCVYYSVGGGFVRREGEVRQDSAAPLAQPYPFTYGKQLLQHCRQHDLRISTLMMANESALRSEQAVKEGILALWAVMQECVRNGCHNTGVLPGGLNVRRRANLLYLQLMEERSRPMLDHSLHEMDWVNLYALAVNEENAAGGRVVTAPTNGAAGIIPAVLHYYWNMTRNPSENGIIRFFLAAAAIGIIIKENASISGAEVGCQGEVGSACAMAAAGLAEALNGTPEQVENAAEIGIEHNLGLTCDPIGGLVQVPCIERNAMGAIKAINAARMAYRGDGTHFVSLDSAVRTMRDTGRDMLDKYKETSRGGLAVNVVEVPVNFIEC